MKPAFSPLPCFTNKKLIKSMLFLTLLNTDDHDFLLNNSSLVTLPVNISFQISIAASTAHYCLCFSLDSSVWGHVHLSASKLNAFSITFCLHEAFPNRLVLTVRQRVTRHIPVLCEGGDHSVCQPPALMIPAIKSKASDMHSKDCVRVAVRVRPFNKVSVQSFCKICTI